MGNTFNGHSGGNTVIQRRSWKVTKRYSFLILLHYSTQSAGRLSPMKRGSSSSFFLPYTTQFFSAILHRQCLFLSLHQISFNVHHGTSGFGAFPQTLHSPECSGSIHLVTSYSSFRTGLKSHSSRKLVRVFTFLDHKFFFQIIFLCVSLASYARSSENTCQRQCL